MLVERLELDTTMTRCIECLILLALLFPQSSNGSVCDDLEQQLVHDRDDFNKSAVVRRVDQDVGLDTDACLDVNNPDLPPCATLLYALHGTNNPEVHT